MQTYTFLYTDIEGSTRLWERQPEAMQIALNRQEQILRDHVEAADGKVFRTTGDGFCAVFSDANAAIVAAAGVQRVLLQENWNLDNPLRVRMAIHAGLAEEKNGDFVGSSLNRLGRLLAAANGGQVLVSQAVEVLVRDQLPKGLQLLDLGLYEFRDLSHPEQISQLVADGLLTEFPPLKSFDYRPHNLPASLTSFIGRESELAEVVQRVKTDRMITLTGPGGTGKTRIALQAAAESLHLFPDGTWWIELAALSNSEWIVQNICGVLRIHPQLNRPLKAVLLEALRARKLLLVFDNCEHLVETCAELSSEILQSCPGVKILATSREMLGISGETLYRVPPLSFPLTDSDLHPEQVENYEAVRLFVERAQAKHPSFKLTSQNAVAVIDICRRVDGIPLAIELAAARVALLTPEQIVARLNDQFRLLTGGSRTALPRQQTLEALFDWSYQLLAEEEKIFFRRLAVFAGGWTLEAAEYVCHLSEGSESGVDALELLSQLVNKSLVNVDWWQHEARYTMLETSRQFAQKKLVESGEAPDIRQRHMKFYSALIQGNMQSLFNLRPDWHIFWEQIVKPDLDNLRAAQAWALEEDIETALLFATRLYFLWGVHGMATEMRQYVRKTLQLAAAHPEYQGELSQDKHAALSEAWASNSLLSIQLGQNQEGLEASKFAVTHARASGDLTYLSFALSLDSETAGLTGDPQQAYKSGEESIKAARLTGDKWALGMALLNTARFALVPLGDYQQAKVYAKESAAIFKEINNPWGRAMGGILTGIFALNEGHYSDAEENFSSSIRIFQQLGDLYFSNLARSDLADTARLQQNASRAISLYIPTIENWRSLGNMGAVARCLECIAFILIDQLVKAEQSSRSLLIERIGKLLGFAETLRTTNSTFMHPLEQSEFEQYSDRLRAAVETVEGERVLLDEALSESRTFNLNSILSLIQESEFLSVNISRVSDPSFESISASSKSFNRGKPYS